MNLEEVVNEVVDPPDEQLDYEVVVVDDNNHEHQIQDIQWLHNAKQVVLKI